jgi:hypothetical protein
MTRLVQRGGIGSALSGLALGVLWAASPAHAASTYEVINGGECLPYPPYNPATNTYTGLNYELFLYGFNGIAFCHLRMTQDWPVTALSYVLYNANVPNGTMTARLCVHTGMSFAVTCGNPSTIPPSGGFGGFYSNWVAPPSPLPPDASGAFLQLTFPNGQVTGVFEIIPVWYK